MNELHNYLLFASITKGGIFFVVSNFRNVPYAEPDKAFKFESRAQALQVGFTALLTFRSESFPPPPIVFLLV